MHLRLFNIMQVFIEKNLYFYHILNQLVGLRILNDLYRNTVLVINNLRKFDYQKKASKLSIIYIFYFIMFSINFIFILVYLPRFF